MREIKRIKRRKISVGVAILSAAVFGVATGKCVASPNERDGGASLLAAAGRPEASAQSENGNGGFWPRLGSNAVSTPGSTGNASWTDAPTGDAAARAQSRVEPANFIGYSGSFDGNERGGAIDGRTRLVDWTTTAPVGETAKVSGIGKDVQAAAFAPVGESGSRSKTPILRDEPTAATRGGGSIGSALVSTFGALAVVLGAFLALVAFLKRTAPNGGGSGGALEIVDSLAVGDKTRLWTIRWGNRLVLAAKTPEKIAPLAEIADVDEANALLAEIERRKSATATGEVGAKAAAIWKRGVDATSVWRTALGAKGRRQ